MGSAAMAHKMQFQEFWKSTTEKEELLKRARNLRLLPSQLMQLLGDSEIRADVAKTRWASLLPPVGTEVFRRLTTSSLEEVQRKHEAAKMQRKGGREKREMEEDQPKPAEDLEAGQTIPFYFGRLAPGLVSTPLEELDPFYQSKRTFVVLSKGNIIHRFDAGSACFLLSPVSPLRRVAISVLIHCLFMLVAVLTNCAFMTVSDPPEWIRTVEFVFISIYALEAVIKILSRGLCLGMFTYLRDPWNWLDLIVIIIACVTEFADLGHIPAMRMLRVFRILKIIPIIPGLKTTVGGLAHSTWRLGNTMIVTLFALCIMAMLSLQFFMGDLSHKCVALSAAFNPNVTEEGVFNYSEFIHAPVNQYFMPGHMDALLCGNRSSAGACPKGYVCLRTETNPNYGYTSYNNFGWAFLSTVRLMTLDFWENLLQLTLRSTGQENIIYFFFVLFFGSFCLRGLFWAVIAMAMVERHGAAVADAKRREDEFAEMLQMLKARQEGKGRDSAAAKNTAVEIDNQETEHTFSEELQEDRKKCHPCGICPKCDCCACWQGPKQRLHTFVTHPFFECGIIICLILNSILMATEHYPMTEEFEVFLVISDLFFISIFAIEMVLKILAMGPYGYFQVNWNIFECILVVDSLVEIGIVDIARLLKLPYLRVLRLAKWWPLFNMLLRLIAKVFGSLRNMTVVLGIVVFLFSAGGMHLFKENYTDNVCHIAQDCVLPRWHMVDFFHAFAIVYRALCGEWIETMWDCMEVAGQAKCMIFYLMLVTIGNLVLASMFLALLGSSFSCDFEAQQKQLADKFKSAIKLLKSPLTWCHRRPGSTFRAISIEEDEEMERMTPNTSTNKDTTLDICEREHPQKHQKDQKDVTAKDTLEDCCCQSCYRCCPFLNIDTSSDSGKLWSNFRKTCLVIVEHVWFEVLITIIVLLSSALLVLEDIHLENRVVLKAVLHHADMLFLFLFVVEMLMKWFGYGLKAYFKDGWCCLDFFVVIACVVDLTLSSLGFTQLGCIKCLRSLRNLSRFQSVKRVVSVLRHLIPELINVLLPCLTLWFIFGLISLDLFAGKFYYCYNETSEEIMHHDSVDNKTTCMLLIEQNFTEIRWKGGLIHFNNLMMGYVALLQMATFKGWVDLLYFSVDSTMVESQPRYEFNLYAKIFFVTFTIASFFTCIFIVRGVVNHLTHQFGGRHAFLTKIQKIEYQSKKRRLFQKPQKLAPRPQNGCQAAVYDVVTSPCFEISMMMIILFNMLVFMLESNTTSEQLEEACNWMNFILLLIFLLECIFKLIALGKHYFKNRMNVMDFVILLVCILNLFFMDVLYYYFFPALLVSVLRLFRLYRVLKLIPWTTAIWKLLAALALSLRSVFNIGLLFFFLLFTFSLVGMTSFPFIRRAASVDDMTNFDTFLSSATSMFMIATTAGWDGFLYSLMVVPPDCNPYVQHPGFLHVGDCGSPGFGLAFVISFVLISLLLVLLMFVALVLEVFAVFWDDSQQLCDNDLEMFYKTWKKFDPDASQCIEFSELSDFCDALKDPLRIPKPNKIKLIHMDIPLLPGDKIHYLDILTALHAQVFGASGDKETLKARMAGKFLKPSKALGDPVSSTLKKKQEEVAAQVIQKAFRNKRVSSDSKKDADK